jgi:hypothetical protein
MVDPNGMKLLFLPVSGPRGMGEYARAVAIALAVKQRWPNSEIRFAVSREAPYASGTPFPTTLLPASPTLCPREVKQLIDEYRPSVVLFDNGGRTQTLREAARSGARVVFISSRLRPRRKGFRLRWMRYLDEHWIAYPEFIAGSLIGIEKLKLRWLGRPAVRFLDTIVPVTDPLLVAQTLANYSLTKNDYVLVVPGGGTAHRGAMNAPDIVAAAANGIAESYPTLMVGVDTTSPPNSRLQCAPRLPMATLLELIRNARLVVSNGGDTLLQVIACQRPCVAIPIAQDQPHRVDACVRQGLAVRAELDTADILRTALSLLASETLQHNLRAKMEESGINDGLKTAVDAIAELLGISEANGAD